jgi:hypothetical protein
MEKEMPGEILGHMLKKWNVPNKQLWLKECEMDKLLVESFKDLK